MFVFEGIMFIITVLNLCRAEQFGDTADECGEAFFLCGKSLLELARLELLLFFFFVNNPDVCIKPTALINRK